MHGKSARDTWKSLRRDKIVVEAIKMAARVTAVAAMGVIMISIFGIMVGIFIGAPGIAALAWGIGTAKAFVENWVPINADILFSVAIALIALEVGLLTYRVTKIIQNVIFKISEG